ncbi:MAG: hypothetical protein H0V17_10130 [Deltaproteobacteria bacterium]|nr:hypothetical protein [Deltaproteobacteria bacterium]
MLEPDGAPRAQPRTKEVEYRIFGNKVDSLGNLIERMVEDDQRHDALERFVIVLCARQLCVDVRRECPELWKEHEDTGRLLLERIEERQLTLRSVLLARNAPDFAAFLDWFEDRFLRRAKQLPAEALS